MPRRRTGFTLVELLVVIGIIAVLIAMLLPALTGARRSANAVKCAAQLRDLGNAIQIYANENQYNVPTQQSIYKSITLMWYDQIAKYVFKNGVASGTPSPTVINDPNFGKTTFVGCPAFDYQFYKGSPQRSATGYGMNLIPLAPAKVLPGSSSPNPADVDDSGKKFVMNQYPSTSSQPARYFKISEFKNPANRALMADANGYGGIQARDPDPVSMYTKPNGNNNFGDVDYYRHSRLFDLSRPGCNVLFADLHVDLCTPWETFYAIRDPLKRANGEK